MQTQKGMNLLVAVAFIVGLASSFSIAGDVPDKITIGGIADKFQPVEFTHKKHSDQIKCDVCHHTYKGEGAVQKCSACHDPKVSKDKVVDLKKAYHDQCIECHKKEAQGGKKAPTKCMECHPKKQ